MIFQENLFTANSCIFIEHIICFIENLSKTPGATHRRPLPLKAACHLRYSMASHGSEDHIVKWILINNSFFHFRQRYCILKSSVFPSWFEYQEKAEAMMINNWSSDILLVRLCFFLFLISTYTLFLIILIIMKRSIRTCSLSSSWWSKSLADIYLLSSVRISIRVSWHGLWEFGG